MLTYRTRAVTNETPRTADATAVDGRNSVRMGKEALIQESSKVDTVPKFQEFPRKIRCAGWRCAVICMLA